MWLLMTHFKEHAGRTGQSVLARADSLRRSKIHPVAHHAIVLAPVGDQMQLDISFRFEGQERWTLICLTLTSLRMGWLSFPQSS